MEGGFGGRWFLQIGGRWEVGPSKKTVGAEVETPITHTSSVFLCLHHDMNE